MGEERETAKVSAADESGSVGVADLAQKRAPTKRKPKQLPPFKVLLHNDDVNHFDHVIRSIVHLTPLSEQEAVLRTIEAHETGVSLLLTTHKERAELYVDQFMSKSVTVTMESA